MRTKTILLLYKSRLFGQNKQHYEFCYPKKKKKTGKRKSAAVIIKCLLTELGTPWPSAKYFPVRPSHSVNKYISYDYKAGKCTPWLEDILFLYCPLFLLGSCSLSTISCTWTKTGFAGPCTRGNIKCFLHHIPLFFNKKGYLLVSL